MQGNMQTYWGKGRGMAFGTRGKIAAMGLAAVLAAGMCPAFASAAELTASADTAKSSPAVQTQAGKKTVYVLESITQVEKGKSRSEDKTFDYSEKQTVKLAYTKKGLLSKSNYARKYTSGGPLKQASDKAALKWTYDKKNRIATLKKKNGKQKYTYGSNGKLKKVVFKVNYPLKYTFAYKSGKIAKVKSVYSYGGTRSTHTDTLSYEKGQVARVKSVTKTYQLSDPLTYTRNYSYDSKGNIVSVGDKSISTTYDSKGLLKKRVLESKNEKAGVGSVKTITYKYKPVKVSSGLASKVKAQQWAILNENLNLSIDALVGGGFFNLGNMFQ